MKPASARSNERGPFFIDAGNVEDETWLNTHDADTAAPAGWQDRSSSTSRSTSPQGGSTHETKVYETILPNLRLSAHCAVGVSVRGVCGQLGRRWGRYCTYRSEFRELRQHLSERAAACQQNCSPCDR